jgi:hypothetical protein
MHGIQKTVEILKLAFESHQHHQFHADRLVVEILIKLVKQIHLNQPFMFQILIVRVGPDAAYPQKPSLRKLELHQIHSVGVLLQF